MDRRACAVAQFEMPGNEICVQMGEDDVFDREAVFPRVVDILINVTLWVDDDGGLRCLIADKIRCVRETAEIILLEKHSIKVVL